MLGTGYILRRVSNEILAKTSPLKYTLARQTGRGTGVVEETDDTGETVETGPVWIKWATRHATHPTPWLAPNMVYFRRINENTPWLRIIGDEIRHTQPSHHPCQPLLPTFVQLIDMPWSIAVHIGF